MDEFQCTVHVSHLSILILNVSPNGGNLPDPRKMIRFVGEVFYIRQLQDKF